MPLIDDLTISAASRNIIPAAFACTLFNQCNDSTNGNMDGGSGCSMSFVGSKYVNVHPKIACIGIDHRDHISNDYHQRTLGINKHYQVQGNGFNQHYQGVVRTAIAFLGQQGTACNVCLQQKKCRKAANPYTPDCVLDMIVQPNLVKCVRIDVVSATSRATLPMMRNCAHHLLAELRLIRPRLAIFHGARLKAPFFRALTTEGLQWSNLPIPQIMPGLAIEILEFGTLAFFFHHPSRNCLSKQWPGIVAPCLDYLQQTGEIV